MPPGRRRAGRVREPGTGDYLGRSAGTSIANNYGQVIKYAAAIRTRTASTEAILSRFTRTASHSADQAMLEIGRVQRTCFVARYLRDRQLR